MVMAMKAAFPLVWLVLTPPSPSPAFVKLANLCERLKDHIKLKIQETTAYSPHPRRLERLTIYI